MIHGSYYIQRIYPFNKAAWSSLQPALLAALGLHLDDNLAPCAPATEGEEGVLDPVEAVELFVRELGAADLLFGDELQEAVPDLCEGSGLLRDVRPPVNPDEGDVLEEDLIHGDLLDGAGGEADDEDAGVPGRALRGGVDGADGVEDDVDAALIRGQGACLLGPVLLVGVDGVRGAEGEGDGALARGGGGGDDGCAEGGGD